MDVFISFTLSQACFRTLFRHAFSAYRKSGTRDPGTLGLVTGTRDPGPGTRDSGLGTRDSELLVYNAANYRPARFQS